MKHLQTRWRQRLAAALGLLAPLALALLVPWHCDKTSRLAMDRQAEEQEPVSAKDCHAWQQTGGSCTACHGQAN
jgi:hypothetical protein